MNTNDLKVEICDIETYFCMFLYCGYDPQQDKKFEFEISFRKNEIDGLVKHLLEYDRDFLITYNGVHFDGQVLQHIIDNHEDWTHYTWRQVLDEIFYFAQKTIDDRNYDLPPKYKEYYLSFKQIDLFLLLHFNNDAKRTSLKWTEFSLDGDIEELPIDFRKEELTSEEIDEVIAYCYNDVFATYNLYKACTGDTDHPDYKGKNKVQLRLDLIDEYKLPHTAINWNDVKIGTELNKKSYLSLSKLNEDQLYKKVKERKTKTGFCFKDCYPDYMKFQTKQFQDFFKDVGNVKINLNEKQEFPLIQNGTTFMFAKGGCHSQDKPKKIHIPEGHILISADVGLRTIWPN